MINMMKTAIPLMISLSILWWYRSMPILVFYMVSASKTGKRGLALIDEATERITSRRKAIDWAIWATWFTLPFALSFAISSL